VACLREFARSGCGIEIQFSDASLGEDLADFLRGLRFEVVRAGEQLLDVRFRDPVSPDDAGARLDLDFYLRVWQAIHPEAWAVQVDQQRPPRSTPRAS
jgi:hypothetical protein